MQKALSLLKSPYFLIFVAAVLVSFTRFSIVALIATCLAWLWVSHKVFGKQFYGSLLTHFFVGFLVFCAINAGIAMGFRLVGAPVPIGAVVAINWLIILPILFYTARAKTAVVADQVKPQWILILASLAIIGSFTLPIVLNPSTANLLNYSSYGYDDGPHIQIYRANIYNQGNIAEINKAQQPDINIGETVPSYPQALHFHLSVFARSVFELAQVANDNVHLLLLNYRVGIALLHGALVVILVEIMAQVVARFRQSNKNLGLVSSLGIAATIGIIYACLIYPQISFSGEAFLLTVGMIAGVILSLVMLDRVDKYKAPLVFGIACIFAIGAVYAWIISLVAAFVALVIAAIQRSSKPKETLDQVKATLRGGLKPLKVLLTKNWPWVFIVAAGVLSLPPILVLVLNFASALDVLNVDGGVGLLNQSRYLVILFATIIGLFVVMQKSDDADKKRITELGALLLSPMVLVILVYLYQTLTVGQVSYYFTKSSYMAYMFMIVLAGALIVHLLFKNEKFLGFIKSFGFIFIIFGAMAIYLSMGRGFLAYIKSGNSMVEQQINDQAGQLIDQGVRPKNIVLYSGRNYEEDMIFNHVTDKIDQFQSETKHIIAILAQRKDYNAFYKFLGDYTLRDEKTYILVNENTEQIIRIAMPANGNYEIIVVSQKQD